MSQCTAGGTGLSNMRWVSTVTTRSQLGSTSHEEPKPPSQPRQRAQVGDPLVGGRLHVRVRGTDRRQVQRFRRLDDGPWDRGGEHLHRHTETESEAQQVSGRNGPPRRHGVVERPVHPGQGPAPGQARRGCRPPRATGRARSWSSLHPWPNYRFTERSLK
jgi:hypothetical protein